MGTWGDTVGGAGQIGNDTAWSTWRDELAVSIYYAALMHKREGSPCSKTGDYSLLYDKDPYPAEREHDLVQAWYAAGCSWLDKPEATIGHLISIAVIPALDYGKQVFDSQRKASGGVATNLPEVPTGSTYLDHLFASTDKKDVELRQLINAEARYNALAQAAFVAGYNHAWRSAGSGAIGLQIGDTAKSAVQEAVGEGVGAGTVFAILIGITAVAGGGYWAWRKYGKHASGRSR